MKIESKFCPDRNAYETIEWERRDVKLSYGDKILFEQKDCEFPKNWSETAAKIVVGKYFYGEKNTSEREYSLKQLVGRVVDTIAKWGIKDGYFHRENGEIFRVERGFYDWRLDE